MLPVAWSAEFPNDNPLLHEGAVWICTTVRGAPRAILRARASLPPAEPEPSTPEIKPAIEPEAAPVAAEPAPVAAEPAPVLELVSVPPEPELAPPDAFSDLIRAVADVVLEAGATRAAAAVPDLLGRQELRDEAFGSAGLERLVARGLLESGPNGVIPSAAFVATTDAWRRVLRGEPADLTECGAATLDQWASELVAALIGAAPTRCDELRRQLRRRGVAAFGMLAAA